MNDKENMTAEFLSGISKETPLFKRMSHAWHVDVEREDETIISVLLEDMTPAELLKWWDGADIDTQDESYIKFASLVYVISKLKAYQEFLEVEGYVTI